MALLALPLDSLMVCVWGVCPWPSALSGSVPKPMTPGLLSPVHCLLNARPIMFSAFDTPVCVPKARLPTLIPPYVPPPPALPLREWYPEARMSGMPAPSPSSSISSQSPSICAWGLWSFLDTSFINFGKISPTIPSSIFSCFPSPFPSGLQLFICYIAWNYPAADWHFPFKKKKNSFFPIFLFG